MSYENFARVYDKLTFNVDYHKTAAIYDSLIVRHGGQRGILLDLACGTGSLSMEFDQLEYDVIGVDASEAMLSQALEKKIEQGGNSVIYLCQTMQELDLYGTIDVTVCALDSINHITDLNELKAAFAKVSLFTNPGGLFLFDANTVYKHEQILGSHTFIYDEPDVYCVWQNTPAKNIMTRIELDLFIREPDGRYERCGEQFYERAYPHETLCALLEETGFSLEAVYDEDGKSEPNSHSQRLIYVAKKK